MTERATNRCRKIVAGLLVFSAPARFQLDPIDIREVVEESLDILKDQIKVHKVKVIRDFASHLPLLKADKYKLGGVFSNLITNACDAMPEGGQLKITTRLSQPRTEALREAVDEARKTVEIEFSDTGEGISEENMIRIFDPFFTTKDTNKGTGLGLSICYGIIKEHGGFIDVKSEKGNIVYLRDVGYIDYGFKDRDSYAYLNSQPVVSLQVVKKSGENLLSTISQVMEILDEAKLKGQIPEDLIVTITNDQSDMVKMQLSNLENSIIMGIIFVVIVLFLFLGTRNSLFVGLAIPMSMFLSFMIMGMMDYRINMIVLFSLILALGMLVDNAIVVTENIYRFVHRGYPVLEAAKQATGEVAMPIISSTATTLAAFFPLLFWKSIMGEFMSYMPLLNHCSCIVTICCSCYNTCCFYRLI